MENKPFIFGVATSGDNFTDREKETERLLLNFRHGVNTVLISPRRWGKTSLVQKVCRLAQSDKLKVVYLDIFSCRSDKDFYDAFAAAVLKQTSSKLDEWLENAKLFLSRISPKISMGTDPITDFSISLEMNPKSNDVDEILQLPEKIAQKKGCNIVVCIDEFQQIAEFKDSKTFQKRLRTVWQLQKSVSYCLFGSKKHLMNELFEKKSLPFYKFGDAIYLPKIGTSDWVDYICGRFEATGKQISIELAEKICQIVDNHSSYVQQLAWLVGTGTEDIIEKCRDYGLKTPEFYQEEDFRVVIWRTEEQSDPKRSKDDPKMIQSDPKEVEDLIGLIKNNPSISRAELARRLDLSERQVRKIMGQLRADERLTRKGGKIGEWIITDK